MITETPESRHESWPLLLRLALAVLIAAFVVTLGLLVYVLLRPSNDASTNALSISSDDPLAVAEFHQRGESPLIGDHWHAAYAIYIGNFRLPNAPTWESGIHTHGDGIIHIHPFTHEEEGRGAALNKWFEYGGGVLTENKLQIIATGRTYLTGNSVVGDGLPGEILVFQSSGGCDSMDLAGQWVRVPIYYIPHDGDCIRIMFETEQAMRAHIKSPPSLPSPPATAPPP